MSLHSLTLKRIHTYDDCVKLAVELLEIIGFQVHLEVHGRMGRLRDEVILQSDQLLQLGILFKSAGEA